MTAVQRKPFAQMTLEERIAELDRMDDPQYQQEAIGDNRVERLHDVVTEVPLIAAEVDEEPEQVDAVQAMQELLLRHENTQVNRVEDPDLVRVLRELRMLAHSNIADVFESKTVLDYIGLDENDKDVYQNTTRLVVKDITQLPREVSACIQSVKVTSTAKGDVVEVRMYDKQVSLEKLMRFHGAYIADNEQTRDSSAGILDLLITSIGSQGMPSITNNDA